MRSDFQGARAPIAVFASVNFVLAGLCALWLFGMIATLVYGIAFSGDQGAELAGGIFGCACLAASGFVGLVVYLVAGFGMVRRQVWGYYMHCVGAILSALTCVGLIYTVVAFVFALRPEFSDAFFGSVDRPMSHGRRKTRSWDED